MITARRAAAAWLIVLASIIWTVTPVSAAPVHRHEAPAHGHRPPTARLIFARPKLVPGNKPPTYALGCPAGFTCSSLVNLLEGASAASPPGSADRYYLEQGGADTYVAGNLLLYAPNNLSDLNNAATARINLGLGPYSTAAALMSAPLVGTNSGGALQSVTPGGDVSFATPNFTVTGLNGVPLGSTTATAGNVLIGSGSQWITKAISGDISLGASGSTAIQAGAVTSGKMAAGAALANIGSGGITDSYLSTTGATAGSYTCVSATVNAEGRITAMSTGSCGGGGGSPSGSNGEAQYDNAGSFGGSGGLILTSSAVTGETLNLGSDATGDLYYNNGGGVLARLGVGSVGQFLGVSSGKPAWLTPSGAPGGSNSYAQYDNSGAFAGSSGLTLSATQITGATIGLGSDATGDLYYNGGSGALTRLAIGSGTNPVLAVSGGLPSWQVGAFPGAANSWTGPNKSPPCPLSESSGVLTAVATSCPAGSSYGVEFQNVTLSAGATYQTFPTGAMVGQPFIFSYIEGAGSSLTLASGYIIQGSASQPALTGTAGALDKLVCWGDGTGGSGSTATGLTCEPISTNFQALLGVTVPAHGFGTSCGGGGSTTCTGSIAITSGDTLGVVTFGCANSCGAGTINNVTAIAVTGGTGSIGTCVKRVAATSSNTAFRDEEWDCPVTSSGTPTVQVTWGGTMYFQLVYLFDMHNAGSYDLSASATATSTTLSVTAGSATAKPGDFCFSIATQTGGSDVVTAGETLLDHSPTDPNMATQYQNGGLAGATPTATASSNSADPSVMLLSCYL